MVADRMNRTASTKLSVKDQAEPVSKINRNCVKDQVTPE
jgi:hypothetical protein